MKSRWVKEEDDNFKFFKIVNRRRRRNIIREIKCEDGYIERREEYIVDEIL